MSGMCGNCDCSDKNQCVKKGNQYGVEIIEDDTIYNDGMVEEGGNCDGCKCGAGCSCTSCSCCSH